MAYTTIDDPEKYMQVKAYTGNGSDDHAITLDGSSDMQPDLVWIKNREEETSDDTHFWFDSVRGVTKYLISSGTAGQTTDADTLDAFQSDGFKVDDDVKCNTSSEKYVAFCWKESATAGFDIVDYDGAGAANHSHSLSAVPKFMIVKRYNTTESWFVYTPLGQASVAYLNDNVAAGSGTNVWGGSDPTSSVFSIGSDSGISGAGDYIAYLFAEKQGFSKFGKFTWGTSNTDGAFIWLGFRPSFFMIKKTSGSAAWYLWNSKTNGYNGSGGNTALFPYHVSQEDAGTTVRIDLLSNGVKFRHADGDHNGSGATYVFMAFAEAPFVNSNGVPCNAR